MQEIDKNNMNKPICYDPERKKFITYDEIISGQEKIINLNSLTKEDKKKLVIERLKKGPDFMVQSISGPPYNRDEIIRAINNDEEIGNMSVEAELIMLKDMLDQVSKEME